MEASQAIKHIKFIRPGSIETKEQENMIKTYANSLWTDLGKNSNNNNNNNNNIDEFKSEVKVEQKDDDPTGLKIYPNLSKEQLKIVKDAKYPELIILCGLPASGKTLFTTLINTINIQQHNNLAKNGNKMYIEWTIANQDRLGKRDDVELFCKNWLKNKIGRKVGLIIDRCNVTVKERKYWIDLLFKPKKCILIHFNIDVNICIERAQKRKNHETLINKNEGNIIRSFNKNFQIPKLNEGYTKIYEIKNTNDLVKCCIELGCDESLIKHYIPTKFFKFPRTHHLWNTGSATRDDIILDNNFSGLFYGKNAKNIIVTEKIDGSNLGISLGKNYEPICQHRGSLITYNTSIEYKGLKKWLDMNAKFLCEILKPEQHILFGEWCQLKHSIHYNKLPNYFIVFDIYDKYIGKFYSRNKLERLCKGKFPLTKVICIQKFNNKDELEYLLENTKSLYNNDVNIEGLYLKIDDDVNEINIHRCKLVRSEFTQNITSHFMHHKTQFNSIDFS